MTEHLLYKWGLPSDMLNNIKTGHAKLISLLMTYVGLPCHSKLQLISFHMQCYICSVYMHVPFTNNFKTLLVYKHIGLVSTHLPRVFTLL